MRTISKDQVTFISAVLTETDTDFNEAILEKDIHVTDMLGVLANLNHDKFDIIFCGGTSLSKAHNLIQRMSEDVDLKLVLRPGILLGTSQLKKELKKFRRSVEAQMLELSFELEGTHTLNEGKYSASNWTYQQAFPQVNSLRPHLSLEFTFRKPEYPTTRIDIDYLHNRLVNTAAPIAEIECVAVEEILAEKVLSFLRRHAQNRAGHMKQEWDAALVRHIYDTYCIVTRDYGYVERAKEHFHALVAYDTQEFDRDPNFSTNPKQTMLNALNVAETEQQCIEEYNTRLIPLIYGDLRPSYQDAFAVFKQCALELLSTI